MQAQPPAVLRIIVISSPSSAQARRAHKSSDRVHERPPLDSYKVETLATQIERHQLAVSIIYHHTEFVTAPMASFHFCTRSLNTT
jgi:hypothetical protein